MSINPSDAELEILQVLWDKGEAKVKEVQEKLQINREVGYTTVLKTMQIMFDKKLVDRKVDGKSHIYWSLVEKESIQAGFLDKLITKVYKGSTAKMVMNAIGNTKTTKEELEQIKAFIKQQENKEG